MAPVEKSPPLTPSRTVLPRVLAASRFVARQRERDPEQFERWLDEGFFERTSLPALPPDAAAVAALRRQRSTQMTRIAFRDIAGWSPLDETLGALSDLADASCQQALQQASIELEKVHGAPSAAPVLFALGKLGGRELNFSSDIDLILGFTENGQTHGPRPLSHEEYFAKLAQAFTRLLSERTVDGFVFRVDWMLRPFGSAGPPAMSLAAMEEYYQTHGREWERYALIKARPVAGDLAAGARFLQALRPFVYRRYLDFNAIAHLRELKAKIEADAQRRGLGDDLKLGDGGIREIEFIVQSFQLMRGGQVAALRDHRLRPVLKYLGDARLLDAETALTLDAAYVLLRRAENAVQMYDDQQTHALPVQPAERAALCAALDLPGWDAFEQQLQPARLRVRQEFRRIFAGEAPAAGSAMRRQVDAVWSGSAAELDPALARALRDLQETPLVKALSETGSDRLLGAVAALLDDARAHADPPAAALRALEIVSAIAGRSTYLALLRDNTVAREHLLRLCAASPWLTRLLARTPALLDLLLDPRALHAPPEQEELRAELARLADEVAPGDTEGAMNLLRRYVQETTLRIAAADLAGALPLVKVSDRLTWLAEAAVGQALRFAQQDMVLNSGSAVDARGRELGLAVIAYGKFGGIELGYGSDLDLVFIHASATPEAETVGGRRALSHAEYFARWVQRTVNLLGAQTHRGRAYEVDLQLRPSGNSGPPVSSLAGFSEYQRQQAWTWEHQALTRARFVAGDARVGAAFEALRHQVLRQSREPAGLRQEIAAMRAKMRASLDKSDRDRFDVKQGRGGIADLEFITQFLVLRDAARAPPLTEWSDNWRQLDALETAGSIGAAQKASLIRVYRAYRAWLHARSLQSQDQVAEDSVFKVERAEVRALWNELIGE